MNGQGSIDPPRNRRDGSDQPIGGRGWIPTSWKGRALLVGWILILGLWSQFALASLEELEFQAAFLGAVVVVILLVAGLGVWIANVQTRDGR